MWNFCRPICMIPLSAATHSANNHRRSVYNWGIQRVRRFFFEIDTASQPLLNDATLYFVGVQGYSCCSFTVGGPRAPGCCPAGFTCLGNGTCRRFGGATPHQLQYECGPCRMCSMCRAAAPCVWTLRVLTRNLLTYLLTYLIVLVNVNFQFPPHQCNRHHHIRWNMRVHHSQKYTKNVTVWPRSELYPVWKESICLALQTRFSEVSFITSFLNYGASNAKIWPDFEIFDSSKNYGRGRRNNWIGTKFNHRWSRWNCLF